MTDLKTIIRVLVMVHVVALFTAPKSGLQLGPLRPEDITGSLLLAAFGLVVLRGRLPLPSRSVAAVVTIYIAYFLLPLLTLDLPAGYILAPVFWFKELSSIVFGYLLWWAFRDGLKPLLTVALIALAPNLLYGLLQLVWRPYGLYGVAPFGHETSPASSGMLFFTYAMVIFVSVLEFPAQLWRYAVLALAGLFVVAAASKVALLGALAFFGWYGIERVLQKKSARALAMLAAYGAVVFASLAIAVSIGVKTFVWRGLSRYAGFLQPWTVLAERGIWWKIGWINTPTAVFMGAGYSPPHVAHGAAYSFGMAMDNQVLYYLVTGGTIGLFLYVLLLLVIYVALPARLPQGRILRGLVLSYTAMGLGAEVLQLSVHGNVFWMMVGLAFAMERPRCEQAGDGALAGPITICSIPKPFAGHIGLIQRNAIASWKALGADVVLFGREEGVAEAALDLGATHEPDIACNDLGTPLVSDAFDRVRAIARSGCIVFANTDIVLMSDFPHAVAALQRSAFSSWVMVGQRHDLDLREPLRFAAGWEARLREDVSTRGTLHGKSGIDFFAFPASFPIKLPSLAVGRVGWDSWLIFATRSAGIPLVDATAAVCTVHQNHPPAHDPAGREADVNRESAGGYYRMGSLRDTDWRLIAEPSGLRLVVKPEGLFWFSPPVRAFLAAKRALSRRFTGSRF